MSPAPPEKDLPETLQWCDSESWAKSTSSSIRQVWAWNFEAEFAELLAIAQTRGRLLAIDVEFPGFLREEPRTACRELRYRVLRENVDALKPIQVGCAVSGDRGELLGTWNFNLQFDSRYDAYSQESLEFLGAAGLDFARHAKEGIPMISFGSRLLGTPQQVNCSNALVRNPDLCWIVFAGNYDFGYLLKMLSHGEPLPCGPDEFQERLNMLLPKRFDLRTTLPRGSLIELAAKHGLRHRGAAHTGGSDALLTLELLFHAVPPSERGDATLEISVAPGSVAAGKLRKLRADIYVPKSVPFIYGQRHSGQWTQPPENYMTPENVNNDQGVAQDVSHNGHMLEYGHQMNGHQMNGAQVPNGHMHQESWGEQGMQMQIPMQQVQPPVHQHQQMHQHQMHQQGPPMQQMHRTHPQPQYSQHQQQGHPQGHPQVNGADHWGQQQPHMGPPPMQVPVQQVSAAPPSQAPGPQIWAPNQTVQGPNGFYNDGLRQPDPWNQQAMAHMPVNPPPPIQPREDSWSTPWGPEVHQNHHQNHHQAQQHWNECKWDWEDWHQGAQRGPGVQPQRQTYANQRWRGSYMGEGMAQHQWQSTQWQSAEWYGFGGT